ncbi:MAG: shikimate kinase [Treponema sp.]|jgi:shikimate kinase|nr:shikimate kinase [Treponema sp.]
MKDIILLGPKHSGKTSAGKALASLLSGSNHGLCEFIDLDEIIFQIAGKTPRQLFAESPKNFQKAEAQALKVLADSERRAVILRRIIAAGGGIADNTEALAMIKTLDAIIVCLSISADTAWGRISGSPDKELPPFLNTENPREAHRALHERRAAGYIQIADVVIEAEEKTPEEIASEINNFVLKEQG